MNWAATISNSLWLTSNVPAWVRFQRALNHPAAAQWQLLRRYLTQHAGSSYGRAHGFASIRSYPEFAARIPISQYDDWNPWIQRILHGEKQVLNSEPVTHLIPTSGSSGARKLIPFTPGLQREWDQAIGPWIADLCFREPSLLGGPAYWSVSPALPVTIAGPAAVPVGFDDDTAYLGGLKRRLVQSVMAVPSALRLVSDLEQFRYLTLLGLLRQPDLRLISVWHPSFLALLLKELPHHWSNLLLDVQNGTCRYADSLPVDVLRSLKSFPMPARAAGLRKLSPIDYLRLWPKLRVISCWSDAHARSGWMEMQKLFPRVLIQAKGLVATEAMVTLPFAGAHPLAIRSHFFEFLDSRGRIRLAHELELGETYEVIVTTGGGLWRYALKDLVQVDGYAGRTPSLRFLGRTGNISDYFGEKLSEPFVLQAMERVWSALKLSPRFALLAPDGEGSDCCHYTLFIEGLSEINVANFTSRLETILQENPHYAWCRKLGQLGPLRLFQIQSAGNETYIHYELTRGKRLGEIKSTPLSAQTGWANRFKGAYHSYACPLSGGQSGS